MIIINCTQHSATPEQKAEGIVDIPDSLREYLQEVLTLDTDFTHEDLYRKAVEVRDLARLVSNSIDPDGDIWVMIGGAPAFMPVLQAVLIGSGIKVGYARTKRESKEVTAADGTVRKVSIFKHAGMYWEGE